MKISRFLILLIMLLASACHLISPYTPVLNKIEKGQYDPASFKLSRIKTDSSTQAYGAYVRTIHFMSHMSPFFKIDSAAKWARYGDSVWNESKTWEVKRVRKFTQESEPFKYLIPEIEKIAFDISREKNTEKQYQHYIDYYPNSRFKALAIQLRDSLAFDAAKKENTYIAYKNFLDKYPNSHQAEDAKEIYELLLYETHTRDKNQESYENFIFKFPHSPYLKEAEVQLFYIYTLDNHLNSYRNYLQRYPQSIKADEARLWVQHREMIYKKEEPSFFLPMKESERFQLYKDSLATNLIIDSVKEHIPCEPFFDPYIIYQSQGKWGMAESSGQGLIPAIFHDVNKLSDEIYNYKNDRNYGLVHVSGFMINDAEFDTIKILNDTFLVTTKGEKQKLLAYNGAVLTNESYDDISYLKHGILGIQEEGLWALKKTEAFLKWPPGIDLNFKYDSLKLLQNDNIIAFRKGEFELINHDLKIIASSTFENLSLSQLGIQYFKDGLFELLDFNARIIASSKFQVSTFNEGFIAYQDSSYLSMLFGDSIAEIDSFEYFRPYYFKLYKDSSCLLKTASGLLDIGSYNQLSLSFYKLAEKDTFCFVVKQNDLYGLLAANGDTLLAPEYQEIRVFDSLNIRVKKKDKYGLVDFNGETILRTEFDAITNYDKGGFTLFFNRRFGYIHEAKDIYLKAYQNESLKLVSMRKPFFSRQNSEGMDLIRLDAKTKLESVKDYKVINDSLIFLNQDFQWHLNKQNMEGDFEALEVSCTGYEIWYDNSGVPHIIFYKATGEGFYDTELETRIYPEYYSVRPKIGLDGKLKYFITFKYFEEINLFLLKLLDRNDNELHKVLITENAMQKMACMTE